MNIMTANMPYTAVDHDTWRRFFQAIEHTWAKYGKLIHPFYMDHVEVLRRFRERIPSLAEINDLLATIGWTAIYVDGLAPPWEIAKWLDRRVMPVSRSIRSPQEVHFANGPDLIHDYFGHLPLLFSKEFRSLLSQWTAAASRVPVTETDQVNFHLNKLVVQSQDKVSDAAMGQLQLAQSGLNQFIAQHPSPSLIFDKVYFWIFEFGILERMGQKLILGAGLLSSLSEIEKIALQPVKTATLDMASVLSSYNISALQDGYLVAPDLQHYKSLINRMIAGVVSAESAHVGNKLYAHA